MCKTTLSANESFNLRNDTRMALLVETEMSLSEVLKLTIQLLIVIWGIIGNITVVIVISHLGKKKQPVDCYVQSLAIADLGTLIIAFPLVIVRDKMPWNWPFGEFACLYLYPVVEIFYGASIWCIVIIAIERYQTMASMKVLRRKSTKKMSLVRAKTVAAVVWLTSFLIFCFPLYFVVDYVPLPNGGRMCGPTKWTHLLATVYMVCLTLLTYILPLVVISLTYIAISRVLRHSNDFIKAMKQMDPMAMSEMDKRDCLTHVKSVRLKQNIRAKKILSPLVVIFTVTMLPLNVFRLTVVFWPEFTKQEYYAHLLYAMVVSTMINSSINPLIYSLVSRDFRKGIKSLFLDLINHYSCKIVSKLKCRNKF